MKKYFLTILVMILLLLVIISSFFNYNYIKLNKKLIKENHEITIDNNIKLEQLLKNDSLLILHQDSIIL